VSFDGTSQYISLPTMNFSGLAQGFTTNFWFKYEPPNTGRRWQKIVDFGRGAGADNIVFSQYSSTLDASIELWNGNSKGYTLVSGGFPANTWIHYVWVVQKNTSSSSSSWKIYQNGELVKTATSMKYPVTASTSNYIAKSHWAADSYYAGKVDSFGVFMWPLQQADATLLFQSRAIKASYKSYCDPLLWSWSQSRSRPC
jgi:hypothetical protein